MIIIDTFPENVSPREMPLILSLDFDGVIHSYSHGWHGPAVIDSAPVPGAFQAIQNYLNNDIDVWIYSARCNYYDGIKAMYEWFLANGLSQEHTDKLKFSKIKPPAHLTIDDRAIQFTGSNFPSPLEVRRFRPWTARFESGVK